nr:MAG TPA: hypothetical protein [Caudoviricetes sp.]
MKRNRTRMIRFLKNCIGATGERRTDGEEIWNI